MRSLIKKAVGGLLFLFVVLAVVLFGFAWTIYYWEAWIFLAVFFSPVLVITVYLIKRDPKLLERRIKAGPGAERQWSQKVIQSLAALAFILIFILSAVDHRFKWSAISVVVAIAGDILVVCGLGIVFFVFRENSFASATIEVGVGQTLVSSGLYGVVRHPMYFGAVVMLVGAPLALGSWWGLLAVVPIFVVIVWRLLDEEVFLERNLLGYVGYRRQVKYRLLPFIW